MERIDVIVLGKTIGSASGWDDMGVCEIMFYEFEPNESVPSLTFGDLFVNFNTGEFVYYDNEGNADKNFNILDIIKNA